MKIRHEYFHTKLYAAGITRKETHHAAIYKWQYEQAKMWKFRADYYSQRFDFSRDSYSDMFKYEKYGF
ncbi:MAG: hypothetical protein PUB21_11165 [Bacteroidales bacterium]|nr:hypothetical protein [Bacteroidales bacterium]